MIVSNGDISIGKNYIWYEAFGMGEKKYCTKMEQSEREIKSIPLQHVMLIVLSAVAFERE